MQVMWSANTNLVGKFHGKRLTCRCSCGWRIILRINRAWTGFVWLKTATVPCVHSDQTQGSIYYEKFLDQMIGLLASQQVRTLRRKVYREQQYSRSFVLISMAPLLYCLCYWQFHWQVLVMLFVYWFRPVYRCYVKNTINAGLTSSYCI
jgi:hypothetical protein